MNKIGWPFVAIVLIIVGAIVGILVFIPAEDAQARSVVVLLVSALTPLVAAVYVNRNVQESREELKDMVNGRMSELIEKVPDPAPSSSIRRMQGR
jgi:membrane protein implicated in regulation of membrane protease activity